MKFSGYIGFERSAEKPDSPGVFETKCEERHYYGDVIKAQYSNVASEYTSNISDVRFKNTISVVSNDYILRNLAFIRYIIWNNSKWKVTDVELKEHRIVLQIGGIYGE